MTHRSTGVPKLSALRILDEVAKLKQAQSTVKQTEERMDNVHMVRRPKPTILDVSQLISFRV